MACRAKARRTGCVICAPLAAGIVATEAVALQYLIAMKIRTATQADCGAIWNIFREVVAAGDTYALDPNTSREDALAYWFAPGTRTYVAQGDPVEDGVAVAGKLTASPEIIRARQILGTYILRPNQSGGGSHVANAGFMVSAGARGQGIGRAMAEHCLSEARRLNFRAMQFNYVISTNTAAIRLWEDLGFDIVGTLPSAFRHPDKGYVDVYVMYRSLLEDQA
jgi:ribosomal protein S18 acetylase RimI-like enzyme